tara:strand:- start:2232 stop:2435 length:204 start_codon:yes stop_codon:yes gene_type:complete
MIAPVKGESLHEWSRKNQVECQCGCKEPEICDGCEQLFTMDLLEEGLCEECKVQQLADRYESYNDLD